MSDEPEFDDFDDDPDDNLAVEAYAAAVVDAVESFGIETPQ